MYFYELHETDDDLFTDLLVAHDGEFDEQEFLELVIDARAKVLERFEEDTLIEAVAAELARSQGFLVIDDSQIRAAVNVSLEEGLTALAAVDEGRGAPADDEAEDFRSMLIEADPEDAP